MIKYSRRIIRTMIETNHPLIREVKNYIETNFFWLNGLDKDCEIVNLIEYEWESEEEHF